MARSYEYDPGYRRYGSAPPDIPCQAGSRYHRRDAPLPLLPSQRPPTQVQLPWQTQLLQALAMAAHNADIALVGVALHAGLDVAELLRLCRLVGDWLQPLFASLLLVWGVAAHRGQIYAQFVWGWLIRLVGRHLWLWVLSALMAASVVFIVLGCRQGVVLPRSLEVVVLSALSTGMGRLVGQPMGNFTIEGFNPSCRPTFVAATCPSVLGIPARLYRDLAPPAQYIDGYHRRQMKCWGPDKARIHPSPSIGEKYLAEVRNTLDRCRVAMRNGNRYLENADEGPGSRKTDLWDTRRWSAPFPKAPRECTCTMGDAVTRLHSNVRRDLELPRTLEEFADYCECSISIAWASYTQIFNITFRPPILPITWSADVHTALGWIVLRDNITFPSFLSFVLPRPQLHGFIDENLPERGIEDIWLDFEHSGLPYHSSEVIGVPTVLTDALRAYGRDGVDRPTRMDDRRLRMGSEQVRACLKRGGCSWAAHWDLTEKEDTAEEEEHGQWLKWAAR
ncbi:hypothetical protein P154DRAFT_578580 [Amniculicola lignicola CBS 123094]|uniref:Uncharacterized protein n=1 Tax=Amniculicola lignicola CBS 123094 TaxID=1392246 RepID=A0A6A5WJK7_9PLEO|nr:hypothetical protein P154DRAFT_578580 [Amniculicola lignicola CBS 123094]